MAQKKEEPLEEIITAPPAKVSFSRRVRNFQVRFMEDLDTVINVGFKELDDWFFYRIGLLFNQDSGLNRFWTVWFF